MAKATEELATEIEAYPARIAISVAALRGRPDGPVTGMANYGDSVIIASEQKSGWCQLANGLWTRKENLRKDEQE